jgi:transposase
MDEKESKLRVVSRGKNGRCRYDKANKRALVEACLRPGVSVSRKAQENGINANLLRKWIGQYLVERERSPGSVTPAELVIEPEIADAVLVATTLDVAAEMAPPAFVPFVQTLPATAPAVPVLPALPSTTLALHVHLPNGVQFDLGKANLEALSSVVQMLGRLPCSGSMKD